jgi:hypothetical protein
LLRVVASSLWLEEIGAQRRLYTGSRGRPPHQHQFKNKNGANFRPRRLPDSSTAWLANYFFFDPLMGTVAMVWRMRPAIL